MQCVDSSRENFSRAFFAAPNRAAGAVAETVSGTSIARFKARRRGTVPCAFAPANTRSGAIALRRNAAARVPRTPFARAITRASHAARTTFPRPAQGTAERKSGAVSGPGK
jgi:hypothetical protein